MQVKVNHELLFSAKCERYLEISLSIYGQEAQRAESEQSSAPNNDQDIKSTHQSGQVLQQSPQCLSDPKRYAMQVYPLEQVGQ